MNGFREGYEPPARPSTWLGIMAFVIIALYIIGAVALVWTITNL